MKRIYWIALVLILLLAACSPPAANRPAASATGAPIVTVYKSPT